MDREARGCVISRYEFDDFYRSGSVTTLPNGIQNNRFKVELIDDTDGYPISLRVTALRDFDKTTSTANTDTIVLLSGRIRLEIQIFRYDKGMNDWELDDDIDIDLEK